MSFFAEMKRRNVFRVGVAYLAAAWLLFEVLSALFDLFGSPGWLLKSIVGLLAVGFPIALLFSWAYEITPEGLKKTHEVDQSESITHSTGKRLDQITIGIVVGLFVGKQLGVFGATWAIVKAGRAGLPDGVTWPMVYGASCLAGIGFTMSLFVSELAFTDPAHIAEAKIGILVASILSGVVGSVVLRKALGGRRAE